MNAAIARLRAEWDSALIGVGVFLFHLWHVPAVAGAGIFRKSNLAFDFDIDRFVRLWGTSPFPVRQNEDYYAVRHPLAVLVRLIDRPLVAAGLDAHVAGCGIAAFCAGISALLAFRIALAAGVTRGLAYILTVLWALSAAPLILGVLPESYDLAFIALSCQFLLAIHWTLGRQPALATRIGLAVANFGITITNVVLSGLSELVCRLTRQPWRKAILGTAGFGAAVAVIGVVLAVLSLAVWPSDQIHSSSRAVKQVYWDAASAERTRERQSPAQVAWVFGAVSFVTPPPARYPSGQPTNPYLYDLRGHDYGVTGWIAVAGWLGLLLLGALAAVKDRQLRPVWIIAAGWIAANLALHSYWQFRDTLFLYSPHPHIAFFVLALAGARLAQTRSGGALAYGAAALLVVLFMALNNLPVYLGLASLN
jgi:hypothetical protein